MKKWMQITIVLLLISSLMGCGMKRNNNSDSNNEAAQSTQNESTQNEDGGGTGEQAQGDPMTNQDGHDQQTRLEVADEAAARVAELEEVDNATVLVTDRNAYVAAVLTDQSAAELTSDLEKQIATAVREADQEIQNVYVSVNPDFVERINEYSAKINEGQPVEGLFEEFTEAVQRVFPESR